MTNSRIVRQRSQFYTDMDSRAFLSYLRSISRLERAVVGEEAEGTSYEGRAFNFFEKVVENGKLENLLKYTCESGNFFNKRAHFREYIEEEFANILAGNLDEENQLYFSAEGFYKPITKTEIAQIVTSFQRRASIYEDYLNGLTSAMKSHEAKLPDKEKASLKGRLARSYKNLASLSKHTDDHATRLLVDSIADQHGLAGSLLQEDDRSKMVIGSKVLNLEAFREKGTTWKDCLSPTPKLASDWVQEAYPEHKPVKVIRSAGFDLDGTETVNTVWEDFLERAVPDDGMREALLQAISIGIFGAPSQFRNFLDLHGAKGSGKSTIEHILSSMFGEFTGAVENNGFNASASEEKKGYALAKAEGARIILMDEFECAADSADIKKITGGGEMRTSLKYRNSTSWRPEGVLVFISNGGLRFSDKADDAFLGRWLPIYFPGAPQMVFGDGRGLWQHLEDNLPGIFVSLAEAFQRAKASGAYRGAGVWELVVPQSIEDYKAERMGDTDPVGSFLTWLKDDGVLLPVEEGDRTSGKGGVLPRVSVLQKGYEAYVKDRDLVGAPKKIQKVLAERGLTVNISGIIHFKGYKLGDNLTQNIAHGIHA